MRKSHTRRGREARPRRFRSLLRHQPGEGNGRIEKCVHASGRQCAQRILTIASSALSVSAAGGSCHASRRSPCTIPSSEMKRGSPRRIAFHGDEDIVPVDAQALSLRACGGQRSFACAASAIASGTTPRNSCCARSARACACPRRASESLFPDILSLSGICMIKCRLGNIFVDIMDIIGILNNIEN